MNFQDSKTKENLARAFAGECQDGARYQFMIKSCKQDFSYISDLLKTLAKNEMAHASVFYQLILKHTKGENSNIDINAGYPFENYELEDSLESSADIEKSESKNIYPAFAKIAKDEGFDDVYDAFLLIGHAEEHHYQILSELDKKYKSNKLYKSPERITWMCSNCGHNESKKEAWKQCPLCEYPQGYVMIKLESKQ